jgi:hypothetical protein
MRFFRISLANECKMTTRADSAVTQFLRKMTIGSWPWIFLNVTLMVAFNAVTLLVMPTQTNEGPVLTGGDMLILGALVLPVYALAILVNLIWLIAIVWKRKWHAGGAWLLNLLIWYGVMYFNVNVLHYSIDA